MMAVRLHGVGDLRLADEPVPVPVPARTSSGWPLLASAAPTCTGTTSRALATLS